MRISLVIPTRERCELLRHCLAAALAVRDHDFEVVVSDNVSADGTAEMLAAIDDPRLKVVRPAARVSMRRNFETALDGATGDYVIFIGDDDGVTRQGMAMLRRLLEARRPDAVGWEMMTYTWPSDRPGGASGLLRIKPKTVYGPALARPAARVLAKLAAGRLRNYRETANIYHGCISRELIGRVRDANGGVYFAGISPDVYSGIANLVHMRREFLWVGHPVTFGGASDRSNGVAHMAPLAPGVGAEEKARFATEAADDAGTTELHPDTASLPAATLDMLRLVDRQHGAGLTIDREAWWGRIFERLAKLPRGMWEPSVGHLRDYARQLGDETLMEAALARHPFAGPEAPPQGTRPASSRVRILDVLLAHPVGLATVADAARATDAVIAEPYSPGPLSAGPLHWGRWARAVRRARQLAGGWEAKASAG